MSAALVLDLTASADMNREPRRSRLEAPACEAEMIDPELSLYRARTIALLRRYFRMSIELGRLPNILGREFFRSKVSSYRITTFEDVVILVHDVDRCLARLDGFDQQLVASVVLEEYSHAEAASLLRVTRRTVTRRLPEALDLLSRILLDGGLLRPIGEKRPAGDPRRTSAKAAEQKSCQEGKTGDFDVSA